MQRLYKRRRTTDDNRYRSNWDIFGNGVYNLNGFIKTSIGKDASVDKKDEDGSDDSDEG